PCVRLRQMRRERGGALQLRDRAGRLLEPLCGDGEEGVRDGQVGETVDGTFQRLDREAGRLACQIAKRHVEIVTSRGGDVPERIAQVVSRLDRESGVLCREEKTGDFA